MNRGPYYYSVGRSDLDPVRQAEIKIKRSTFICSMAYAGSMGAAKEFIARVSRENRTATHNCWAYVVGDRGEISHASDAGEPAGTAGKPILNTLQSHGMTCTAAVVTRYFGGVKLGIRGLIEAYSLAATAAIDKAPLVRLVKTRGFRVELPYAMNDTFLSRISAFKLEICHTDYGARVCHDLSVELSDLDPVERFLTEYAQKGVLTFRQEEE